MNKGPHVLNIQIYLEFVISCIYYILCCLSLRTYGEENSWKVTDNQKKVLFHSLEEKVRCAFTSKT